MKNSNDTDYRNDGGLQYQVNDPNKDLSPPAKQRGRISFSISPSVFNKIVIGAVAASVVGAVVLVIKIIGFLGSLF